MSTSQIEDLRQHATASRTVLQTFLAGLSQEQWDTIVYADGDRWRISDLLRHLNRAEYSMIRLMDNIRQGGEGASPDFDLDRWNASGVRKTQEKSVAELMADMKSNRDSLWEFMASLSLEDLEKRGRHGTGQIMSIAQIIEVIAGHDRQHLEDIKQALAR